jgi:UDP-2,4-diacetamido-2,4,6-trideoxy-beta-L-altropyranose hydrolase
MMAFHFCASPEIGTGHARRCAVLAHALSDAGAQISLIADSDTIAFAQSYMPSNCDIVTVDGTPSAVAEAVARQRPHGLVVDRYDLSTAAETSFAAHVRSLVVLDDFAGRSHVCDFLIDQNIGRDESDWRSAVPDGTHILAGGAYALLRSEFIRSRQSQKATCGESSGKRRIFVSFGGADPLGLVNWLMPALSKILQAGYALDMAVGTETLNLSGIQLFADKTDDVTLHVASNDVAILMAQASVSIGAPGSMTLERSCLGLPQILVSFADNQIDVGRIAEKEAVARYLGDWQQLQPDDVVSAALDLLEDSEELDCMSRRSRRLVDGRGARRVVTTLLPETDRQGEEIRLRPIRKTDADDILKWQNTDGMRRFSGNPRKIERAEHENWIRGRLANAPLETYLAYDATRKSVGLLHLKADDRGGWWISLLVAPEAQGRGIGPAMLRLLARIYRHEPFYAEIQPDNVASIRTFEGAGFVSTGDDYIRAPSVEVC